MRTLILMAAGKGRRAKLGKNKVLHKVQGKTILEYTLNSFLDNKNFNEIIIVTSECDYKDVKKELKSYDVKIVIGDKERYLSVKKGVDIANGEIVYVHDAARPYFNSEDICKIEESIKKERDIKCFSIAQKINDSICQIHNGKIKKHLNRDEVVTIQTPQVFYKEDYLKIFNPLKETSDETTLFKNNGYEVQLIISEKLNDKITNKNDVEKFEVFYGKN